MATAEEVARARLVVCEANGHATFRIDLRGNAPVFIRCDRCGRAWPVGEGIKGCPVTDSTGGGPPVGAFGDPEWAMDPVARIQKLEAEVERLRRGLPARLTIAGADRTPLLVRQLVLRSGSGFEWAAGPEDLFLLQRMRVIRIEVPQ